MAALLAAAENVFLFCWLISLCWATVAVTALSWSAPCVMAYRTFSSSLLFRLQEVWLTSALDFFVTLMFFFFFFLYFGQGSVYNYFCIRCNQQFSATGLDSVMFRYESFCNFSGRVWLLSWELILFLYMDIFSVNNVLNFHIFPVVYF